MRVSHSNKAVVLSLVAVNKLSRCQMAEIYSSCSSSSSRNTQIDIHTGMTVVLVVVVVVLLLCVPLGSGG